MNDLKRTWLRLCAVCLVSAVLAGCGSAPRRDSIPATSATQTTRYSAPPTHYVVRTGDTLYNIAWRYGLDYKTVAALNAIAAPYTIFPGQRLRLLPNAAEKPRGRRVASVKQPPQPTPAPRPKIQKSAPRPPAPLPKSAPISSPLRWQWPISGTVIEGYDPRDAERKGMRIRGSENQQVFAAATGMVVYSGTGLVGYGRVVIIKHDETWLSAYGFNKRLLVREGDRVQQGKAIAELGASGDRPAMLHFEIRRNGQPVDPQQLLPRR